MSGRILSEGYIFDLDGVIVDTAEYHFWAWKKLARELGFEFDYKHNEKLKGVSRRESLEVVLQAGGIAEPAEAEKVRLAECKNMYYLKMVQSLDATHILPGIIEFLDRLRAAGKKIALGSASKSGTLILEKLHLTQYFDAIVDGNLVSKAKPDSAVFETAASMLRLSCSQCVVIEDSVAGVRAAKGCHMRCIGIGASKVLGDADIVLPDTSLLLSLSI